MFLPVVTIIVITIVIHAIVNVVVKVDEKFQFFVGFNRQKYEKLNLATENINFAGGTIFNMHYHVKSWTSCKYDALKGSEHY